MIFDRFKKIDLTEYDPAEIEFPNETQHLVENRPPGQIAFNKALLERDKPNPTFDVVDGPWMSNEVVMGLPQIRRDFHHQHNPKHILSAQARDEDRNGVQHPNAQSNSTKNIVFQEQSIHTLTPPREIRDPVDREVFKQKWLSTQRDAAMTQNDHYENNKPYYPEEQPIMPKYRGLER